MKIMIGHKQPDAQSTRLACLRCLSHAVTELGKPERGRLRTSCWRHTGLAMSAHGGGEHIGMEGHPDYTLPEAGIEVDPHWYAERDLPCRAAIEPSDSSSSDGEDTSSDSSSEDTSSNSSSSNDGSESK